MSAKKLAEPTQISSATWAFTLLLLIITFLATFSWYTGWSPFAYFFKQEPEPHQLSNATAVIHPTEPDSERVISPDQETSEQAAPSSSSATEPATAQEQTSEEVR